MPMASPAMKMLGSRGATPGIGNGHQVTGGWIQAAGAAKQPGQFRVGAEAIAHAEGVHPDFLCTG